MPKRQVTTTRASEILSLIDSIRRDTNTKGFERWRAIDDIVTTDLKLQGEFFNTQEGLFYFDDETGRAFSLDDNAEFAALIGHRYGLNKRMFGFKNVLADLQSEAVRDMTVKETNCTYRGSTVNTTFWTEIQSDHYRMVLATSSSLTIRNCGNRTAISQTQPKANSTGKSSSP
jgi:hypothetical protein